MKKLKAPLIVLIILLIIGRIIWVGYTQGVYHDTNSVPVVSDIEFDVEINNLKRDRKFK